MANDPLKLEQARAKIEVEKLLDEMNKIAYHNPEDEINKSPAAMSNRFKSMKLKIEAIKVLLGKVLPDKKEVETHDPNADKLDALSKKLDFIKDDVDNNKE